VIRLQQELH
jgi:chromosome segregation ATPase